MTSGGRAGSRTTAPSRRPRPRGSGRLAAEPETPDAGTGRVRLTFKPDGGEVRVPAGTTVFDGASWNGIAIDSTCGGHGTCRKCKVRITSGNVPIDTLD